MIIRHITIEQIIQDEQRVQFQPHDSFLLAYPEFIAYLASHEVLTQHHLIIAANFTYGWMPTMFEFRVDDLAPAIAICNQVKAGHQIGAPELERMVATINNSLVGASKLLHFINPHQYPIWDSRVYRYITGKDNYYQLCKTQNYLSYLNLCTEITQDSRFATVQESISKKMGYVVTAFRAVEVVMFECSGEGSHPV
ncbi:MAG: hypothetical protein HC884_03860 [Chloroflexaceae bacterium]|nr:hypothetical protein [Chloroflexaceae bacterium]